MSTINKYLIPENVMNLVVSAFHYTHGIPKHFLVETKIHSKISGNVITTLLPK